MEAIPFSEPPWLNGHPSPYYSDSHREWQNFCRKYISEHLTKYAMQWENEGAIPEGIYGGFLDALVNCSTVLMRCNQANSPRIIC